jgi:hypothetical protein
MPASQLNAGASQFNPPQFGGPQVHPEFGYLAPTVRFRRKFTLLLEGVACGVLVGAVAMFFATMEREEEKAVAMLATPMLITPVSSAAMPSAATPASPKASAPIASGPAATASTPAASRPGPAAPAAFPPTVSKPGSSTPALVTLTSTPPQTAAVRGFAPVRFVPESIALPAVTPRLPPVLNDTPPAVTVGASASVSASASVQAPADATEPTPSPAPSVAAAPEFAPAPAPEFVPAPAPEIKAVVAKPKKRIVREPTARRLPPEPEPRTAFAGPFRRSSEPPAPGFWRPLFGFGF